MLFINGSQVDATDDINQITSDIFDISLNTTETTPIEMYTSLPTSELVGQPHGARQEDPIKMFIHLSSNGAYELHYDRQYTPVDAVHSESQQPSTILYEINLYCSVCDHHYRSLIGFNRHLTTRKHAEQVAKQRLANANERDNVHRSWPDYESCSSAIANSLSEDTNTHKSECLQDIWKY